MKPRGIAKAIALALALGVTFSALGFGVAAPAQAVTVPAAGDFTPSGSKAREVMINVLSSVLKGATPEKWRREQIANTVRFDHGWETLDAQLGGGVVKNGKYLIQPDSYDDVVLKQIELHETGKAKTNRINRPAKVPATKLAKLEKLIGIGTGVMIGSQLGFSVGKGVSELLGFDADHGLCHPGFEDFGMISTITGTDCSNLYSFHPDYDANGDVIEGVSGGRVCMQSTPNRCLTLVGSVIVEAAPGLFQRYYLFRAENNPGISYQHQAHVHPNYSSSTLQTPVGTGAGQTRCREAQGGGTAHHCLVMGGVDGPTFHLVRYSPDPFSATNAGTGVTESEPDPERFLTCHVIGTDGNTYTMESEAFRGSDGKIASPECPALPDGVFPANWKVTEDSPAGSVPLLDEPTTQEFQDWATQYPECRSGACPLYLHKKNSGASGVGLVNCLDLGETCRDWFHEPNKEDLYQCTYGAHDVVLAECNIYEGAFKPERLAVGAPYSDPETGEWSGGQSSPTAGSQLMGTTIQDPEAPRQCWPTGWAMLNPVEWVLQPVKCALEWAFVPRVSVIELQTVKMSTALDARAPGQLAAMVGDWNIDPTPMTGCRRVADYSPADAFSTGTGQTVVWDVCPGSETEWLGTTARLIVGIGFAVMVFLAIKKYVGRTVDY